MQRFLLLVCVLCMCTMTVYAQKASNNYPIYNKVKKAAEKYAMPEFTIASEATTNLEALGHPTTQKPRPRCLEPLFSFAQASQCQSQSGAKQSTHARFHPTPIFQSR